MSAICEAVLVTDLAGLYLTVGEFNGQLAYYYGPIYPGNANRWDFIWDATSTGTDNGSSIIQPTAVSGAGRWIENVCAPSGPQVSPDFLSLFGPAHVKNKPLTKRATTDSSGSYTWTFSKAFPAGVTPVVGLTPEDNTSGLTISHKITAISNTSVTIQLARQTSVSILGISVLGIASNAATVVHLTAANPTD